MKTRISLLTIFSILLSYPIFAQVSGLSYSLSPSASYVRWHEGTLLKDGLLYGGELGLGFGELVELRGLYQFGSSSVDTDKFSYFSAAQQAILGLQSTVNDVKLTRIGGNLRFNLSRKKLIPFLILGTGIQRFEPENRDKTEVIYLNAGVGLTFSALDRYTISLMAQNTGFRFNPGTTFYNLPASTLGQEEVTNWSLNGSLAFYLGGRRPGGLTDIDKEMMNKFSGGFGGLSLPVEPFISQINFHDDLPFRNTRVAGVNAGLDFGRLVGIRGFYWKPLEGDSFRSFDDLTFYGAELNFRLNESSGFVPYLTLGGGNLKVGENYLDRNGATPESQPFAMGGGGIILPLNRNIMVNGGIRSLIMTNETASNLSSPQEIKSSLMFHAGVNLVLGKKPEKPLLVRESEAEKEKEALMESEATKLEQIETEYKAMLEELELKYLQLRDSLNVKTNAQVGEEEEVSIPKAEQETEEEKKHKKEFVTFPVPEEGEIYIRYGKPGAGSIKMGSDSTNAEKDLKELIRAIIQEMGLQSNAMPDTLRQTFRLAPVQGITATINNVDSTRLQEVAVTSSSSTSQISQATVDSTASNDRVILSVREEPLVPSDTSMTSMVTYDSSYVEIEQISEMQMKSGKWRLSDLGIAAGIDFKSDIENKDILVALRPIFTNPMKRVQLGTELIAGFTDKQIVSLSGFGLFPIGKSKVQPYAGGGVGVISYRMDGQSLVDDLYFTFNLIGGIEIEAKNNRIFLDYTTRNLGEYNQALLGYRIRF